MGGAFGTYLLIHGGNMATGNKFDVKAKLTTEQIAILKSADPSNYISIRFSYSMKYILPFEDGVKLLQCLQKVEQIDDEKITPVKYDSSFDVTIISKEDYIEYKMNHLLNKDKTNV